MGFTTYPIPARILWIIIRPHKTKCGPGSVLKTSSDHCYLPAIPQEWLPALLLQSPLPVNRIESSYTRYTLCLG